MAKIYQVETDEHRKAVRQLFWEYLEWANAKLGDEYGIDFDIHTILEEDMDTLEKYLPPDGRLFLAESHDNVAGIACMRKIRDDICEVKRMYVREDFRGQGIGKMLLEYLIEAANASSYARIRLDSSRFMHAAHSLYRSFGFEDIAPYPESEIPEEYQSNWIFMEKNL